MSDIVAELALRQFLARRAAAIQLGESVIPTISDSFLTELACHCHVEKVRLAKDCVGEVQEPCFLDELATQNHVARCQASRE